MKIVEYPCPDCGSEGPHKVTKIDIYEGVIYVECSQCSSKFEIDE